MIYTDIFMVKNVLATYFARSMSIHTLIEKDLGVKDDSALRFEEHISEKVKKANTMVGLIRRSFSFLDCELFIKLYTTFVRPHLEYAQSVWPPHLLKQINILENVQIRATKLVDGLQHLDYPKRLKKLNIPTLAYRRLRGDMIELYQHLNKYDRDTITQSFQQKSRISRNTTYSLYGERLKMGSEGCRQTHSITERQGCGMTCQMK